MSRSSGRPARLWNALSYPRRLALAVVLALTGCGLLLDALAFWRALFG